MDPDPGVKKAPDPGSGSATLDINACYKYEKKFMYDPKKNLNPQHCL
jgi:hypothetical protein